MLHRVRVLILSISGLIFFAGNLLPMPPHPDLLEKMKRGEVKSVGIPRHARFRGVNVPHPKKAGAVTGTYKCLVILIGYTGDTFDTPQSTFNKVFNQDNYDGTGSVNDYYQEISYGEFGIDATIVGPYTASENKIYYAGVDNGTSTNYPNNAPCLVEEAVDAAEAAGMDFSQFDNDGDGWAESLFVIHAGRGHESTGSPNDIHSHMWSISSGGGTERNYDGVRVDLYSIEPELNLGLQTIEIGVICHEYGHILGLPDFYDTDSSSFGIGIFGLMSFGSWGGDYFTPERPVHMCAWSKTYLGWVVPDDVSIDDPSAQIRSVGLYPDVLKLGGETEYFLVANRQKDGFDADLPGSGLLIWHIDEDVITNEYLTNTVNDNEYHKGVDLEEADGRGELDIQLSYGDIGDYFPGFSDNRRFSRTTNPSSNYYGGDSSGVKITDISDSASIMYMGTAIIDTVNVPSKKKSNIFTPNQDGVNDGCEFEEPDGSYKIKIYDITSRLVKTLDNRYIWNGKDDDGGLVETGVYIYQIISDDNVESGTVVVAK